MREIPIKPAKGPVPELYWESVGIRVRPACKWRFSPLPVLTYLNVRRAPVLETDHFGSA
jgi:hypothetical protein